MLGAEWKLSLHPSIRKIYLGEVTESTTLNVSTRIACNAPEHTQLLKSADADRAENARLSELLGTSRASEEHLFAHNAELRDEVGNLKRELDKASGEHAVDGFRLL